MMRCWKKKAVFTSSPRNTQFIFYLLPLCCFKTF